MTTGQHRVLVIEDDPDYAFLTRANLEASGHRVVTVASMHDALDTLEDGADAFDAVLLDLGLPDIDPAEAVEALTEHRRVPVIVLTADARSQTRAMADRMGAAGFLVRGDADADAIEAALSTAVHHQFHRTQAAPTLLQAYTEQSDAVLKSLDVLSLATGLDQWAFLEHRTTDDIVRVRFGAGPELQVGARIRWHPDLLDRMGLEPTWTLDADKPTFYIGREPFRARMSVVAIGGIDVSWTGSIFGWSAHPTTVPRPRFDVAIKHTMRQIITSQHLEHGVTKAARRADIALNAASADSLTGLLNRRAYDAFLRGEEERCQRFGRPAVVFIIDLDDLKTVNDTKGHAAGDAYIRGAGPALGRALRDGDGAFRIGGDEFAVLATDCDAEAARSMEQRIRDLLERQGVSASIGWGARPPHPSLTEAAAAADAAMYSEKITRRSSRGQAGAR